MEKINLKSLFNKDIKGRYKKCESFDFGIEDIKFDSYGKIPIITIYLCHYKTSGKIIIEFKKVWAHTILEESNIFFHEEEKWIKYLFLGFAQNSGYKKMLESYTMLGTRLELSGKKELLHFRVFVQNLFIDVLTEDLPTIQVID